MLFIPIDQAKSGMVLAQSIYLCACGSNALPLISAGQCLTKSSIRKLKEYDVFGIYIESKHFEDLEIEEIVGDEIKREALENITVVFEDLKSKNDFSDDIVDRIYNVSHRLVNQILRQKNATINVMQLKNYDDYTYQHSLAVSILSIVTGISLGMKEQELVDLSLAALLHDIGKIDVPIAITNKPDKLTEEEFIEMKKHPEYGVDRIRNNKRISYQVANAIYSHHEKIDGKGYPRGVTGDKLKY